MSKGLHRVNEFYKNETFDKIYKGKLRRVIYKKLSDRVDKNLKKEWMLRCDIRADN